MTRGADVAGWLLVGFVLLFLAVPVLVLVVLAIAWCLALAFS